MPTPSSSSSRSAIPSAPDADHQKEETIMAQAIRFNETGGPEVLRLEQAEVGEPGPGQARVRHSFIAVNFIDIYFRTGQYPLPLPSGLGSDAVGVVEAVRSEMSTGSGISTSAGISRTSAYAPCGPSR